MVGVWYSQARCADSDRLSPRPARANRRRRVHPSGDQGARPFRRRRHHGLFQLMERSSCGRSEIRTASCARCRSTHTGARVEPRVASTRMAAGRSGCRRDLRCGPLASSSLLPSRSAAQLVTIHDVHFLSHPERTSEEIRRDYPALAAAHARRADRIIVSSHFAAGEVQRAFNIDAAKIAICPAGAPEWSSSPPGGDPNGYILFMGTLAARKNIGGLLHAYGQLLSRHPAAPRLVIAGGASSDAAPWLEQIAQPPLAGHVEYLGYVATDRRERLFRGARLFVLPSFEEGFGLPALEAMAAGVPVVASARGSLPEVIGDAGLLIDPENTAALADAVERVISDDTLRKNLSYRGTQQAAKFSWSRTATDIRQAYSDALLARRDRQARPAHAHRH